MLLNTELHNTLKEVNLYNEIKDIIDNHFTN